MYNPNHRPTRTIDPYTLLADYHLNNLMNQADRARLRKEARRAADDPIFRVYGNVAYAGLVEGVLPAPREAARQPAGGFRAFLRRVITGLARNATGTPGLPGQVPSLDQ